MHSGEGGGGDDFRGESKPDEKDFLRAVGRVGTARNEEVVGEAGDEDEAVVEVREGVGGTLRVGVFETDERRLLNNMFGMSK